MTKPGAQISNLSNVGGVYVASNYGKWALRINGGPYAIGTPRIYLTSGVIVLPDGRIAMPFYATASVRIGVGTNMEDAAVTSFLNCFNGAPNNLPSIVVPTTKAHGQGEIITSATSGLFEACADAYANGGGTVEIDNSWTGTAQNITDAGTIFSTIVVEDNRT